MTAPRPWKGGLPWNDPAFSKRMLREHLSQEHGAASRTLPVIDAHVRWLHGGPLEGSPGRVLDLGCGPGLYTSRLAALGHSCVGIDFAPAAIEHAREQAAAGGFDCAYRQEDLRTADLGTGHDLITFLFGDLDTIDPDGAADLVGRAGRALSPGGRLVLEVHTRSAVEQVGTAASNREFLESGLFSDNPHELWEDSWWYPETGISVRRYLILEPPDAQQVTITTQARGLEGYRPMLEAAGFERIEKHDSFGGVADPGFEVLEAALA